MDLYGIPLVMVLDPCGPQLFGIEYLGIDRTPYLKNKGVSMPATECVRRADLIDIGSAGYLVRKGDEVLSVQPDSSIQTRPQGSAGPWEVCRISDDKLIFEDSAYPTGSFALLLVD